MRENEENYQTSSIAVIAVPPVMAKIIADKIKEQLTK